MAAHLHPEKKPVINPLLPLTLAVAMFFAVSYAWSGGQESNSGFSTNHPAARSFTTESLPLRFTTAAYQKEALRLVIQEANAVARELQLPEDLPITESNLTEHYINPFGLAQRMSAIGNVTTKKYLYYISLGNKFSYLEGVHQEEDCQKWLEGHLLPKSAIDTNAAYQMATQWLSAVSVDVKALNESYPLVIETSVPYLRIPRGRFLPVYSVYWARVPKGTGSMASVRLFAPSRTLMQLRVEDPKYILRQPVQFTNLQALFIVEPKNSPGDFPLVIQKQGEAR